MIIKLKSKSLFLNFINQELKSTYPIYFSVSNSGMDVGRGFPNKCFTLLFLGEYRTFILCETIPNDESDQYLDTIYQHLSQHCDFQELNTIKIDNGTLLLD